jgi:signal transduction histidine kinase
MGTPLASMLLRVQMLKEDVPDIPECEDVSGKLDSIEKQILYGQRVIQRLLRFVSKPVNEKQPESVFTLFDESTEIIKPLLKKNGISLELIIPDNLSVLADSNLLHLVFSDTMMNAVDAMPEGGAITVTAYRGESKETVYIEITDTGVGISEDTIPYVFEPFYTTKPAGKGTGLGLSVAKRVIHDHGGEVSIKSKVHSGTTVLIKLPILNEEDKF